MPHWPKAWTSVQYTCDDFFLMYCILIQFSSGLFNRFELEVSAYGPVDVSSRYVISRSSLGRRPTAKPRMRMD